MCSLELIAEIQPFRLLNISSARRKDTMRTRGSWRSRNPRLANVLAVAIAVVLVGWPAYGVLRDDFAVPVGHGNGPYYHFHGAAAWLMFAGFACLGASILVGVSLRLKANPDGKTGRHVAEIMGIVGAFVTLAMMVLKSMGLV
jgi:hypothetical protein